MNKALFLRDPLMTEFGRNIIKESVILIHKKGFEQFTFKKLALRLKTAEPSIYRYFENKHRLLIYLTAWYWNWLQYHIQYQTHNIKDPQLRLKLIINILTSPVQDDTNTNYVNENLLHQIVIAEGSKAYLTKHVSEDNKRQLFKPYKDLCAVIGNIISAYSPKYKHPKSLASTIIEMSHFQNFFMQHLPSLTDFGKNGTEQDIEVFLYDLIFSTLKR